MINLKYPALMTAAYLNTTLSHHVHVQNSAKILKGFPSMQLAFLHGAGIVGFEGWNSVPKSRKKKGELYILLKGNKIFRRLGFEWPARNLR